ncbi:MAG: methyltransferase domain-containing protein, partial [Deinococcota bacterium]
NRAVNLQEAMDADCDLDKLYNTYRNFARVNPLVSRWRGVYKRYICPLARAASSKKMPLQVLDIGFGGGDVVQALASWARQDGLDITFHAIDSDPRALEYVQHHTTLATSVQVECCTSCDLIARGLTFDVVISNHVLHHLTATEVTRLCEDSAQLSRQLVLHNDLERSGLAYGVFGTITMPLFRGSFITEDGLASIRRSFTKSELQNLVPEGWQVSRLFPYRLLLHYQVNQHQVSNR